MARKCGECKHFLEGVCMRFYIKVEANDMCLEEREAEE